MQYQVDDWRCFDYDLWFMKDVGFFRGPDPRPLGKGDYVCVIGSAYTLGRFCESAYPQIMAQRLGSPVVNLGVSAAGPTYFTNRPKLFEILNGGSSVIIQILSARSSESHLYKPKDGKNIFEFQNDFAREVLDLGPEVKEVHEGRIFNHLFQSGKKELALTLIADMRANWIKEMNALIAGITVPVKLFWFSKRSPDSADNQASYSGMCGQFPQLVNRDMINQLNVSPENYFELVSKSRGTVEFVDRFTGAPGLCRVSGNKYLRSWSYYTDQQMQQDAADGLCAKFGGAAEAVEPKVLEEPEIADNAAYLAVGDRKFASALLGVLFEGGHEVEVSNTGPAGLSAFAQAITPRKAGPAAEKTVKLCVVERGRPPAEADAVSPARCDIVFALGVYENDNPAWAFESPSPEAAGFEPVAIVNTHCIWATPPWAAVLRERARFAFPMANNPVFNIGKINIKGKAIACFNSRAANDFHPIEL